MSTTVRERLLRDLPRDEDFRYEYDEEFLNTYISTQIRVLRESPSRKMTQAELAKAAKTGQSQISEMEGDYSSWSLRTLRKLARAFGVRLFVTFESWGELIPRVEGFNRERLDRASIENDPLFNRPDAAPRADIKRVLMSQLERAALGTLPLLDQNSRQPRGDPSLLPGPGRNTTEEQRGTTFGAQSSHPRLFSGGTDQSKR